MLFFFNDTATTEIYTLSLHDALPILAHAQHVRETDAQLARIGRRLLLEQQKAEAECYFRALLHRDPYCISGWLGLGEDRKSTRLNSSHANISYAVFCLKKTNSDKHPS